MTDGFLGVDHVPFNHRLRTARLRRGWNRRALALEVGMEPASIGAYEALRTWPSRKTQERIAEALLDDPDYLFPPDVGVALRGRSVRTVTTVLPFEEVSLGSPDVALLTGPDVEDEATAHLLREQILAVLDSLPGTQRRILVLRYGLEGGEPMSQKEIAAEFGVTSGRISQIEKHALRRLRQPSRSMLLRGYVPGLGVDPIKDPRPNGWRTVGGETILVQTPKYRRLKKPRRQTT